MKFISMKAIGRGFYGLLTVLLVACSGVQKSQNIEDEPSFVYEPINLKKVAIPKGFSNVHSPVFMPDGETVIAYATEENTGKREIVWGNAKTGETGCVTCGGEQVPGKQWMIAPFPDGKRLFLGFAGVLECYPSVLDCQSYKFLPYDLESVKLPVHFYMGASPKLAPDGEHMAFSSIRTDGYLEMVIAKLVRQEDKYVLENPKVINPDGPTSWDDTSVENWSLGAAMYEFKTFTRGGAAVTYVQVGGADAMNPDVWEVDLKTGVRTRLTYSPDWDEDNAMSPDGKSMSLFRNITYHAFDWTGGMLPRRGFMDAIISGAMAGLVINSANNFYCSGPMWILPPTGDDNGTVAGQPIVNYKEPKNRVTVNVLGWPTWNAQSTMLTLQMTTPPGGGVYGKNTNDYIMVAEFPAREPSQPIQVVSSEVGDWAKSPADYRMSFGFNGEKVLNGPAGGTVTLTFKPEMGVFKGNWRAVYDNYSEDGKSFLNGSEEVTIYETGQKDVHIITDLKLTGERNGYIKGDLKYYSAGLDRNSAATSTGTITVNYEGTTVSGPPAWLSDTENNCPDEYFAAPQLETEIKNNGKGQYTIKVTASIKGIGQNQKDVDTRPVKHALIEGGGQKIYTDGRGVATVSVSSATQFNISAGDTFVPTEINIDPKGKR